jgi:hypothetical protein
VRGGKSRRIGEKLPLGRGPSPAERRLFPRGSSLFPAGAAARRDGQSDLRGGTFTLSGRMRGAAARRVHSFRGEVCSLRRDRALGALERSLFPRGGLFSPARSGAGRAGEFTLSAGRLVLSGEIGCCAPEKGHSVREDLRSFRGDRALGVRERSLCPRGSVFFPARSSAGRPRKVTLPAGKCVLSGAIERWASEKGHSVRGEVCSFRRDRALGVRERSLFLRGSSPAGRGKFTLSATICADRGSTPRSSRRRDRQPLDAVALDQRGDQARPPGLLDEVGEESRARPSATN